ncbi:hypothetical protein A9P82_07415 [Arachidicoccus ginsenosidimutans]|uniref:hypothetical protein n=1 Tax=Arachidicoccus sp. BS20 TaxID=1850526 RepID=UPI0007F0B0F2|nr:hypothetical protein [Arachidicoccus sp. BS20]ANI89133.1 hypothetical protein A9P82_07415 [Arachidicoccus sp. BS20]
MKIIEVQTRKDVQDFLEVAARINSAFPNYIRPLDNDVEEVFNPHKNKNFQHGKIIRWILKDNDLVIGRIASFINEKYKNFGTNFPVGSVGFFECTDNQDAANFLFDTAKNWLQQQGVDAMDGPINFGDRDKYWGLLVDGFHEEPIYGMAFNPPYYQKLFENYGFQNFYNQYYYAMNIDDALPEKYRERADKFKSKQGYIAKHIDKNNLEKHAEDFATVYNAAWSQHNEGKEIAKDEVLNLFQKMKPIIDERIIWFAYFKDEPIAMWINIPDLNQYFKHFNGKFGLIEKLRLLYMKKKGTCKRFTGIAFGVVPKFQALGIDAFMICEGSDFIQSHRLYERYEMGWTGDWNPRMLNIYKGLGGIQNRQLITYRYIFDNKHPFERHPEMDYSKK